MERYTIKYRGVELEVEGIYEEGENATYDYPGSSDQFYIEAIYVDSQDILNLLSNDQIDEIEVEILNKL